MTENCLLGIPDDLTNHPDYGRDGVRGAPVGLTAHRVTTRLGLVFSFFLIHSIQFIVVFSVCTIDLKSIPKVFKILFINLLVSK